MHRKAFPSLPHSVQEKDLGKEFTEILGACEEFTFSCDLLELINLLGTANPIIK